MSYIDKNLLPDERICFRTRKHLIIFFFPVAWTLFSIYLDTLMKTNIFLAKVAWAPWLVALIYWLYIWLEYITAEFAVTDKRVMMREGFFHLHMNETRLSAISQVNVNQGILGRIFNFGMVSINAFGAYDAFTLIAQPLNFQNQVNQQIDKVAK